MNRYARSPVLLLLFLTNATATMSEESFQGRIAITGDIEATYEELH